MSVTLRQRLVSADVLGRVNAANRTLSMTAAPIGALTGGAIATGLGLSAPLWVSGAALAALTLTFVGRPRAVNAGTAGVAVDAWWGCPPDRW